MNDTSDNNKQKNQMLFMHLVMMMSSSAMQQMGKTVNPMTNKTSVDLDGAAFAIDMLDMIAARTAGNLDAAEERMLKAQLADLRLNFVEASDQASKQKAEPQAGSTDATAAAGSSPSGKEETDTCSCPDKEQHPDETSSEAGKKDVTSEGARFHKSYG